MTGAPNPAGTRYTQLCQHAAAQDLHVELRISDRYDHRFECYLVARLEVTDRNHVVVAGTAAGLGSLEVAANYLLRRIALPSWRPHG